MMESDAPVVGRGSAGPGVSVIIVSYRSRDMLLACLESIYAGESGSVVELIVIDNASGDGTPEAVRHAYPQVRVIESVENLGFARAVNRAAEQARGDYVLLLNPDMLVHEAAIDGMVCFAEQHPAAGFYGGVTLDREGNVDPRSCWGRPTIWSLVCFATGLSTVFARSRLFDPESLGRWQRDTVREVPVVTGCLLLADGRVWRQLGGFDESYFMYGEDVDLSLRAWELGYRPLLNPKAKATHFVGASSETSAAKAGLLYRGKATFVRKRFHPRAVGVALALLETGVGLRALVHRMKRDGRDEASPWEVLWATRHDWRLGYACPTSRT